jgi:NitT/TauT family transport system substrate-binding protein
LLLHWMPQAQFSGYYVALEKGYYRDAGIDLTVRHGGPDTAAFRALAQGEVTFCTGWLAYGLMERDEGVRLVNLAQLSQRSALMIVARKESGILRLEDLQGRRVGLWTKQFFLEPMMLFRNAGVSVRVVPNYTSVNLFLKRGVDAITAMWYNEFHVILDSGIDPEELTLFFLRDFGLDVPEDGLYCMEQTLLSRPDLCSRFVNASLKGWRDALENQEEAVSIVMKYAERAHTGTNRAHQRWMLARMAELMVPDADKSQLGRLRPSSYAAAAKLLTDSGVITQAPPMEEFARGLQ